MRKYCTEVKFCAKIFRLEFGFTPMVVTQMKPVDEWVNVTVLPLPLGRADVEMSPCSF